MAVIQYILLPALSHEEKVNEVLVAWCGSMPKRPFEVIHGGPDGSCIGFEPLAADICESYKPHNSLNHGVAIVSVVVHTVFHFRVDFLFVIFCVY